MITTYEQEWISFTQWPDWRAWVGRDASDKKFTAVFVMMQKFIHDSRTISFDNLLPLLKNAYDSKECKSCLRIDSTNNTIDLVPPRKIMPLIWIVRKS